jgi:hypothetical protein
MESVLVYDDEDDEE